MTYSSKQTLGKNIGSVLTHARQFTMSILHGKALKFIDFSFHGEFKEIDTNDKQIASNIDV